MIIDAHTHVWPDSVASRALADAELNLPRFGDGTLRSLTRALDDAGVDQAVCLAVAPRADHVGAANQFVSSLGPRFLGFGSIHPELPVDQLIAGLTVNGLIGAKVHPVFQGYRLDDPRLNLLWEALEGNFVVSIHVGPVRRGSNDSASPQMVRDIVRRYPRLDIIACHLGGYLLLPEAADVLIGERLFLDTSWPPSLATLEPGLIRKIISRHGPDRVIFGSDWPLGSPRSERESIERLALPAAHTSAILGDNLQRLLHLDP